MVLETWNKDGLLNKHQRRWAMNILVVHWRRIEILVDTKRIVRNGGAVNKAKAEKGIALTKHRKRKRWRGSEQGKG